MKRDLAEDAVVLVIGLMFAFLITALAVTSQNLKACQADLRDVSQTARTAVETTQKCIKSAHGLHRDFEVCMEYMRGCGKVQTLK